MNDVEAAGIQLDELYARGAAPELLDLLRSARDLKMIGLVHGMSDTQLAELNRVAIRSTQPIDSTACSSLAGSSTATVQRARRAAAATPKCACGGTRSRRSVWTAVVSKSGRLWSSLTRSRRSL